MRIHVKLFAVLRERAGVGELALDVPEGATVGDAAALIASRFPELGAPMKRVAFAVNRAYVRADAALAEGDELALIPPVSGG